MSNAMDDDGMAALLSQFDAMTIEVSAGAVVESKQAPSTIENNGTLVMYDSDASNGALLRIGNLWSYGKNNIVSEKQ